MSTDCESISSPRAEATSPSNMATKSRSRGACNLPCQVDSPMNSPLPPHSPSSLHSNCSSSSGHSGDATSRSSLATIECPDRLPSASSSSLISPVTCAPAPHLNSTASQLSHAAPCRGSALKSSDSSKHSASVGAHHTFRSSLKRELHSDSESDIDVEGEGEGPKSASRGKSDRHLGHSDCSGSVSPSSVAKRSPHQVFKRGHSLSSHQKSKHHSLHRSNHCDSNVLDNGNATNDASNNHTSKSSSSSFSSSPPPIMPPKAHRSFLIDDILSRKSPDHRSQASSIESSESHLHQQLLTSLSPSQISPTTLGRLNQLSNQLSSQLSNQLSAAQHAAAMMPIVRPWEAMLPNLQSSPASGKRTPSAFYQRGNESASPASIAAATAAALAAASASPSVVIPSLGHQRHSFSAFDARHVHPSLYLRRRSVSPKGPLMGKGAIRPRSADDDTISEASSDLSEGPNNGPSGNSGSNSSGTSGNGSHGERNSGGNRGNNDNGTSPLDALFDLANKALDRVNGDKASDASGDHINLFNNRQPPKKKRKSRTAFTNHQIFELEKRFLYQKYLSPADRDELAGALNLTGAQVITWFQNRRAKLKRDVEELKKDMESAKMASIHKRSLGFDVESVDHSVQVPGCNLLKTFL